MNIRVLGAHNCEDKNARLVTLLIDDILALDAGGLTSTLTFSAQQTLRAILLTHQHYDHTKDIPLIAMNFYLRGATINIFSTQPVRNALAAHLLDGKLYPNFLERPQEKPTINFTMVEPYKVEQFQDYDIMAVPVNHAVPSVGYQITIADGTTVFYTGDTGSGLSQCWEWITPQLLIIEVTIANRFVELARESGHLTPELLKQELLAFRELKGYLPKVLAVHMNPELEQEIAAEIAVVSEALNSPIVLGYEGMQLEL